MKFLEKKRIYMLFPEGSFINMYTYYEAVLSIEGCATVTVARGKLY
jgi:hypothetical protein